MSRAAAAGTHAPAARAPFVSARARLAGAGALLAAASALFASGLAQAAAPADLIVVHARVYGANAADAVAVQGERIVALGTSARLLAQRRGPATRVIEGNGATLLPGIHDGHVHFLSGSLALARVRLDGVADVAEMQRRIRAWADAHPDAPWILGRGWMYAAFGAAALPHRRLLDEIVPDRPVYLRCADGHSGWANSRALALAGITKDTPDPPNGVIVRDPVTGEPTGALKESAAALVADKVPEATRTEKRAAMREALALAARLGVTRIRSLGGEFEELDLLAEMERAGELTARFDVSYEVEPPALTEEQRRLIAAARERYTSDRLAFGGVKLFLDGVIDTKTAAMLEPYTGDTARGATFWKREDYMRTVAELDRLGVPLATHAIGDAAIRLALDGYEAAARANGSWRGRGARRHSVEHIEAVSAADIPRFARLGVIASQQPLHASPEPGWIGAWAENAGPERAQRAWAWGDIERAGGRLVFGSDWPVATLDPWAGLQMALTRQYVTKDGQALPAGGWIPRQRVSLATALAAYTANAAWVANRERDEGSIAVGKLADLVLVDRDLARTAPLELGATQVRATIVGGRVVYAHE